MNPMVDLRGVTKRFGAFTAVNDVTLPIASGEFLTLLGPSGCGKTTLLRLMAGFDTPTEGSVWIGGEDVTHRPPYRRPVNQVFQSYALFPHLTIFENGQFIQSCLTTISVITSYYGCFISIIKLCSTYNSKIRTHRVWLKFNVFKCFHN